MNLHQAQSDHQTHDFKKTDSDVLYSVSEHRCCRSCFLVKVILGGLSIAFPAVIMAGICYLFREPEKAHQLFAKDSVGSLKSTNKCQQRVRSSFWWTAHTLMKHPACETPVWVYSWVRIWTQATQLWGECSQKTIPFKYPTIHTQPQNTRSTINNLVMKLPKFRTAAHLHSFVPPFYLH